MTESGRIAWAITGTGHYLRECLDLAEQLPNLDLFLSEAAAEVLQVYGYPVKRLNERFRICRDSTASAPTVGLFYKGIYDLLVVAPAGMVKVSSRQIGLENAKRLKDFEYTRVMTSLPELGEALSTNEPCRNISSF